MFKVLKYAKKQWYIVIFIIMLLFVQVYCELTLPDYTSDIVDVGIQNQGVEYPVPVEITKDSFDSIQIFMDEDGKELLNLYYKENGGVYRTDIGSLSEEEYDELKNKMLVPEMIIMLMSSDTDEAKELQKGIMNMLGVDSGAADVMDLLRQMPENGVETLVNGIRDKMKEYPDYMAEAAGVSFVKAEYEKLSVDMNDYQMSYLKNMAVKMLSIAILAMLVSIVVGFLSSRLAAQTAKDVRSRIFYKVMSFSNAEMDRFSTSSLITRCTNDIQQIQMVLTIIFRMVVFAPIMGGGAILKVLNSAVSMSWTIVVAVAAVSILILALMAVAMPKFKMMQKLVDALNLVSREILTGLPVIRAFGREEYEEERFDKASRDLMKTQLFTSKAMALMFPTMTFIMNGVSVLIVWVGAGKIDTGNLQVGEMMAFLVYAMHIVMSFLFISMVSIMLPRAAVAADRIDEVLVSETLIMDKDDTKEFNDGKGQIEFSHVSFRYPEAKEDALSDIDFSAKAGQTTAIIGSTGCGKSTLVNLIPRLYDVREGSIKIDGVDIRDVKMKELRKNIGFVPQKGTLFSGTIASNISFGKPDAKMDEIKRAAKIAQASDFIDEKENQYDSDVAQGGNNVSGGQKQRIAIARAIAKSPMIYVFDDSFSALDFKTDAALRRALNENMKDATVIIVAQRISTIMHADQILVLDEGKIVGKGTHEELMNSNEIYRQIAESQIAQGA